MDPNHSDISIRRQCALLQLNRSTYYYQEMRQLGKVEVSQADQILMKEIDKAYTEFPYYGSRKIAKHLSRELNRAINRKRIQRLMRIMGIAAIYSKPRTSIPNLNHKVYPYLLRGVIARHPNHIWGVDITYIRLQKGWLYLVALLDWYSRYILAWELSDSLKVDFCIKALAQSLETAIPKIHNSDQGSQFTSLDYLALLKQHNSIKISMDGRGRVFDNIFTERLWRTVKQEEVYLHDYQSPIEARQSLTDYLYRYNHKRIHASLDYQTPAEIYFEEIKLHLKYKKL